MQLATSPRVPAGAKGGGFATALHEEPETTVRSALPFGPDAGSAPLAFTLQAALSPLPSRSLQLRKARP